MTLLATDSELVSPLPADRFTAILKVLYGHMAIRRGVIKMLDKKMEGIGYASLQELVSFQDGRKLHDGVNFNARPHFSSSFSPTLKQ